MIEAPEYPSVPLLHDDDGEERPRFAEQRLLAARLANLPERLLLNRARFEGEAHRRSESAEQEALSDD